MQAGDVFVWVPPRLGEREAGLLEQGLIVQEREIGPILGHVVGGAAQVAEAPDVRVGVAYLNVVRFEDGRKVDE
jgi:hypothetical protein